MRKASENWLAPREAAKHLEIGPRAVYRLIDEQQLPAFRVGRDLRLRTADVEAWAARRRA